MRTSVKLKAPDSAEVTLTVQSTVGELRRLHAATDKTEGNWSGPLGELRDQIRSVITQAEASWSEPTP